MIVCKCYTLKALLVYIIPNDGHQQNEHLTQTKLD